MFPIEEFKKLRTPFYYYDTNLLRQTLKEISANMDSCMHVHYAVKACANPKVLAIIAEEGFGADCVSGGEIKAALQAGFPADKIVYAGVGKSDWEIELGLEAGIFAFNVESIPELEIINSLALQKGKVAQIALRINPNVGAHTHANITTGLAENKFGIDMQDMEHIIALASSMEGVRFTGLHFHIGSQILEMDDFAALCIRINELQDRLEAAGISGIENINVDLMFGIPYQTKESLMKTLRYVVKMGPEHISLYDLILEPGTKLFAKRHALPFPSEDEEADMYLAAVEFLAQNGYAQYEVSNFARPGYEAMHNSAYWKHVPYVGLGPGAHSFLKDGRRRWNEPDLAAYLAVSGDFDSVSGSETLTSEQLDLEKVMLGLRTSEGLPESYLRRTCDLEALDKALSDGNLERLSSGNLCIPESRFFISDSMETGIRVPPSGVCISSIILP